MPPRDADSPNEISFAATIQAKNFITVMAGLVPAIHVLSEKERRGCPAQGRA
jgi:hypothetical protein